jgi:hypothetical protein
MDKGLRREGRAVVKASQEMKVLQYCPNKGDCGCMACVLSVIRFFHLAVLNHCVRSCCSLLREDRGGGW